MRLGPYHFLFYPLLVLLLLFQFSLNFGQSCAPRSGYNRRNSRKPLYLKQRVPDTDEFSLDASGKAKGKITRNSSKFDTQLVSCYISDIVFKDEEGTGADRIMSKRCLEKLRTLAEEVKRKWRGQTKLRVIEAWDDDGSHSSHSLHYEGRAVDITTSDLDQSKYPELGRLAVESGFDWVYYESRTHIHASVREEDAKRLPEIRSCFNSDASVHLENGSEIPIKDLKTGQKVQGIDENGKITYTEVLMFLDFDPWARRVPYIILETENPSKKLTMTKNHLIFYKESNSTGCKVKAKPAGLVKQGEYVMVHYKKGLLLSRVKSVSNGNRDGMVAPLTQHGNLFVDGVLVSCYSEVKDHYIAHMAFSPVRLLRRFAPSIFKKLDNSENQKGMHWFPTFLISLNNVLGIAEYA